MNRSKSVFYQQPFQETLIKKVKDPLKRSIETLTDQKANPVRKANAVKQLYGVFTVIRDELPKPTPENTRKRGSHIMIGIRDEFFRRLHFPAVSRYVAPMVDFVIIIYETDLYDQWINWWVWEIKKSDWPEMRPMEPDPHFFYEDD